MDLSRARKLKVTGEVYVEPVTTSIPKDSCLYLVMGPTGAGKSTFIEAFAANTQTLAISKDQLSGYTQSVSAYRLVNMLRQGRPVYLIDTPGFSDTSVAEIEIINMVRKWLKQHDLLAVRRILYLIPITQPRLGGSRRKTIEMLKALLGTRDDTGAMVFITTMWDTLGTELAQKRAEYRFSQLRDEICTEFFGQQQVSLSRFVNTRSSAIQALDSGRIYTSAFSQPLSSASSHLYQDLLDRIDGALQQKRIVEFDLQQPESQDTSELKAILERNHLEKHELLNRFIAQLVKFGTPPTGLYEAAQRLSKVLIVEMTLVDAEERTRFQQWARELDRLEEPIPTEPQNHAASRESSSYNVVVQRLQSNIFGAFRYFIGRFLGFAGWTDNN